jgi:hypothetical protein
MSAEAIIPDLDTEGDRLIASEPNVEETPPARAVRFISGAAAGEVGLATRHSEAGAGESRNYILKQPDGYAVFTPGDGDISRIEQAGEVEAVIEDAEDVWLLPRKRLPHWGDWSAHLTCMECTGALRKQDRVNHPQGWAHEGCWGE